MSPENPWEIELDEDCRGGLALMERLTGYDRAILIDAVLAAAAPGTVQLLGLQDLPTQRTAGTHDAHLATALRLGRLAGYPLPPEDAIEVVAVVVQEVFSFGEECTPAVAAAIPQAADLVLERIARVVQT
jgi:hydrogenase maturation protease